MSHSQQDAEVTEWLGSLLSGRDVPKYERNEMTAGILSQLMNRNKCENSAAELIIEDMQHKTEEYQAEAERLNRVMTLVGLTPSSLSQNAVSNLKSLAALSVLLGVQSPSTSNVLLAMNDLAQERLQLEHQLRAEQKQSAVLASKLQSELQRSVLLKRALSEAEEQRKLQVPDIEKKTSVACFLQTKARDYRRNIDELKLQLSAAGVDPSIFHSNLVKKSEVLAAHKEKLKAVKNKLDSYHTLPPDIVLARVKIEEAKQELATLEAELTKRIDLMHM